MKWRREAAESRSIWPHICLEDVIACECQVKLWQDNHVCGELTIDNSARPATGRLLDLSGIDALWDTASIVVVLDVQEPRDLRSEASSDDDELSAVVVARNVATRWRTATACRLDNPSSEIEFSVDHGSLRGDAEILPYVILARDSARSIGGMAHRAGSIIATGMPVTLRFDPVEEGPGGGMDVKWERFPTMSEALYRLEIDESVPPVLYMNSKYGWLQPIVDNPSRSKNARTAVRDALFGAIASDVWMQLAHFASDFVQHEGWSSDGSSTIPESILDAFARQIKSDDAGAIYEAMAGEEADPASVARLRTRLQHSLRLAERFATLVETIGDDNSGGD